MTHVSARNVKHLAMLLHAIDRRYHPAGGLRMGNDPETSVTDARGRVHGARSRFVSGIELYPTIGTANPRSRCGSPVASASTVSAASCDRSRGIVV